MAPAYQNINSGQVVVSDEPRPDLEALARWAEVPVPDETVPPAGTPMTEAELAEAAAREAAPDSDTNPPAVDEIVSDDPNGQPVELTGVPVGDGEIAPAGETVEAEAAAPAEVPVPDETWTDEQLDALGAERGITWRSNASKATKVAKLTAPAAE